VSRGAEVEASYRDLAGRSAYLNGSLAFTGRNCLDSDGFDNFFLDAEKGNCDARQNAPLIVTQLGVSSQLLLERFHVSGEVSYMSERGTQDQDETVPAYVGANLVVYLPDVNGFDVTIGARNLVAREEVPAQSDYNRTMPRTEVLRVPGPGREVFARAGYRF
jgi:outer membrane receptor protein involved in Fe transport